MSLCIGISMHDDSNKALALNSLPIDELGKGAPVSGWCQAKCEPRAGCPGIHGNPERGNHQQAPSHRETQWRYLPASILSKARQEGRGKLRHKCTIWSSKLHDLLERVRLI